MFTVLNQVLLSFRSTTSTSYTNHWCMGWALVEIPFFAEKHHDWERTHPIHREPTPNIPTLIGFAKHSHISCLSPKCREYHSVLPVHQYPASAFGLQRSWLQLLVNLICSVQYCLHPSLLLRYGYIITEWRMEICAWLTVDIYIYINMHIHTTIRDLHAYTKLDEKIMVI